MSSSPLNVVNLSYLRISRNNLAIRQETEKKNEKNVCFYNKISNECLCLTDPKFSFLEYTSINAADESLMIR